MLAGGEIDYGDSVVRLVDYWVLSLESFTWMQIPAQMPIPLIEPRLTANSTGLFLISYLDRKNFFQNLRKILIVRGIIIF